MSTHRQFSIRSARYGDKFVPGIEIVCGKCREHASYPVGSIKGKYVAPDSAENAQRCVAIFERNGWHVGKRPQDDKCPDCLKKLGIEKKTMNPIMEAKLTAALAPKAGDATEVLAALTATNKPRDMSREEGRIIFAKIEEVYRDEKHGYQNGWSDHRVSADLNCPRAWVEQVRKQFFGPEGSSDEVRQVAEQARAYMAEASTLIARAEAMRAEAVALAKKGDTIQRRLDAIEKTVGA